MKLERTDRNTEGMDLTAVSRFTAKATAVILKERGFVKDLTKMACVRYDRKMKIYTFK